DLCNDLRVARGWIDALHIHRLTADLARAFRANPLLRLLRELTVEEAEWDDDTDEQIRPRLLLDAERLRHVRHFRLGPRDNCHMRGEDAFDFVRAMPKIEELYLYAHRTATDKIFSMSLPHLRVLHVYHIYAYPLQRLAQNGSLRDLRVLSLWPHGLEPGHDHAYISAAAFRSLVESPFLTGLTHLEVYLSDLGDDGCED